MSRFRLAFNAAIGVSAAWLATLKGLLPSQPRSEGLAVNFNIERMDWTQVSGWAFSPDGRTLIEAWGNGAPLRKVLAHVSRPDVAAHFKQAPNSLESGFVLEFDFPAQTAEVDIVITAIAVDAMGNANGGRIAIARRTMWSPNHLSKIIASADQVATAIPSPFPAGVEAILGKLSPGLEPVGNDDQRQASAVDKLGELAAALDGLERGSDVLIDYFRYLRAVNNHFTFVAKYFPAFNLAKDRAKKDWSAKPNSPHEMLSVANQLYVLKSHGVRGDFAEFGCFKGFSSSMLSYACQLLGVQMHIFDSFEGLPESESQYYRAGDFKGSLDEVQANLGRFGAPGAVQFHKGYFARSLPPLIPRMGDLMALWLDVDLWRSARDVMTAFDKIDPRGAIFSHECPPHIFRNLAIAPGGETPENVALAICDAYASRRLDAMGRHITLNTGAFWRAETGLPVLSNKNLLRLIASI